MGSTKQPGKLFIFPYFLDIFVVLGDHTNLMISFLAPTFFLIIKQGILPHGRNFFAS